MNRRLAQFSCVLVLAFLFFGCSRDASSVRLAAMKQADDYVQREQYAQAIVAYRTALQADPKSGEAHLKLADTYVKTKDAANAAREYIRAADELPGNLELQLKVGHLLLVAGQFQDAKTKAQQILTATPDSIDAQLLRANAAAGLKDLDTAISDIEEALRMDPARARSYANLGAAQMVRGNHQEAEAAFRRAVELEPSSVQAHLALANFFVHEGRRDDAAAAFEAALALDPRNASTNRYLALHALTSGRAADAEQYLKTLAAVGNRTTQMALAEYYMAMDRKDEARKILKALAGDAQTFTLATVRLASLEYSEGGNAAARQSLDEVLVREPKNAEALVLKARISLDARDLDAARKYGEEAVAADPGSAAAQFMRATILATLGDHANARLGYLEVVKLNPQMTAAHVALARLSLADGANEEARTYAEQALKQQADNPDAKLVLARASVALGDLRRAETESAGLVNAYPQAAAAHVAMGTVHFAKHVDAAGVRSMNRALELDPANLQALRSLVLLDIRDKKWSSARGRVDKRLSQTTPSAPLLVLAAATYISTGDPAMGERFLKSAIDLDSANLQAYAMLGTLYTLQNRLAEARSEFERIAQRNPRSIAALTMVAVLLDMEHNYPQAEAAYEKVLSIDSGAAIAANNLAWMLVESGRDLSRALTLAQTAKAQLPEHPSIDDTLGWIYFKSEMFGSAVTTLQSSVDHDANDPMSRYHLGFAYARTGDLAKSKTHLVRALQMNPKAPLADEARRVLSTIGE
jgi:Tfp pilus assembly protein PilF